VREDVVFRLGYNANRPVGGNSFDDWANLKPTHACFAARDSCSGRFGVVRRDESNTQLPLLTRDPSRYRSRTKEQKEYDKAIDSEYQSAIKKIPEQKKSDPWGDIRSTAPAATKNK
jgi:hypothetical protein